MIQLVQETFTRIISDRCYQDLSLGSKHILEMSWFLVVGRLEYTVLDFSVQKLQAILLSSRRNGQNFTICIKFHEIYRGFDIHNLLDRGSFSTGTFLQGCIVVEVYNSAFRTHSDIVGGHG